MRTRIRALRPGWSCLVGLAGCIAWCGGRLDAQAVGTVMATARVLPAVGWSGPATAEAPGGPAGLERLRPSLRTSVGAPGGPASPIVGPGRTPLAIRSAVLGRRCVIEVAVLGH